MSPSQEGQYKYFLAVVIVNYKTPDLTIDCLKSLAIEIHILPKTQIIVTDNDSQDNSVEQLQTAVSTQGWQSWAKIMPLDHNGGYAFGNNAAIRHLLNLSNPPQYILLLNPDTIVRPNAIQTLLEFMEKYPEVGIAGSRLEEPDATPQRSAFRFHSIWSELDGGMRLGILSKLIQKWIVAPPVPEQACPTDWVAGASMMIRREVFDDIGLLDESYFMYYEEVDFCLQAQKAGWSCWYVPESRVVHLVGQSSGVTDIKRPPKRRPQYWFNSRRRYFLKNHGWFYTVLTDIAWISGYASWRLRRILQRKPDNDPPYFLSDFLHNSVLIRGKEL